MIPLPWGLLACNQVQTLPGSLWAGVWAGIQATKEKNPSESITWVNLGGDGGIRTLDEALHPILP